MIFLIWRNNYYLVFVLFIIMFLSMDFIQETNATTVRSNGQTFQARNITFNWSGKFERAPVITIKINGITLKQKLADPIEGSTTYLGSIPFIQSENSIEIRSNITSDDVFIIEQGGREACAFIVPKAGSAKCEFSATEQPTFLLAKQTDTLSGKLKVLSAKSALGLSDEHFSNSRYLLGKTGVASSKLIDGEKDYNASDLKRATFSNLSHIPRSALLEPTSENGVFVLFRSGEDDLEPLIENSDVFGITVIHVLGVNHVVAEFDRQRLIRILNF